MLGWYVQCSSSRTYMGVMAGRTCASVTNQHNRGKGRIAHIVHMVHMVHILHI